MQKSPNLSHRSRVLERCPNAVVVRSDDKAAFASGTRGQFAIARWSNGSGLMGETIWHDNERQAWRDASRWLGRQPEPTEDLEYAAHVA